MFIKYKRFAMLGWCIVFIIIIIKAIISFRESNQEHQVACKLIGTIDCVIDISNMEIIIKDKNELDNIRRHYNLPAEMFDDIDWDTESFVLTGKYIENCTYKTKYDIEYGKNSSKMHMIFHVLNFKYHNEIENDNKIKIYRIKDLCFCSTEFK
jgi:hypothetical protein